MSSKFQKISVLKAGGKEYKFYSLKELEKDGHRISRLPYPVRIILESLIRNIDGKTVTESDVENLLKWNAAKPSDSEIPFKVARVVLIQIPVLFHEHFPADGTLHGRKYRF